MSPPVKNGPTFRRKLDPPNRKELMIASHRMDQSRNIRKFRKFLLWTLRHSASIRTYGIVSYKNWIERHWCHEPRRESGHARFVVGGLLPIRVKSEDRRAAASRTANTNCTAGNANNGTIKIKATIKPSIWPRKSSAPRPVRIANRQTQHRSCRQVVANWPCPKRLSSKQVAPNFWSYWITSLSKSSTGSLKYQRCGPHNSLDDFKRHQTNNLLNK